MARLLFVANDPKYFVTHRLRLACAAREAGYEVHVATFPDEPHVARIRAAGLRFHPVRVRRGRPTPWGELAAVRDLVRLYRRLRPDVVHHVTLKPVLYGTWAARRAGVPAVVNAVTGLGYLFVEGGVRRRVLRRVFLWVGRAVFRHANTRFIFQNPEDLEVFVGRGLAPRERSELIRGSGVETSVFAPAAEPSDPPTVVLPSRMLWHKGIGDFVEAARRLRGEGSAARFVLVGEPDPANPHTVPAAQLAAWRDEGVVEWWGYRSDMPAVLGGASVVTLPTVYREGVPKVLIEAASCGRALVATDMPGCREIVRHERNGLLVPPGNAAALAQALKRLLEDPGLRHEYGERGRELVETEFAIEHVIERTLEVYRRLTPAE